MDSRTNRVPCADKEAEVKNRARSCKFKLVFTIFLMNKGIEILCRCVLKTVAVKGIIF